MSQTDGADRSPRDGKCTGNIAFHNRESMGKNHGINMVPVSAQYSRPKLSMRQVPGAHIMS